jgi:light-independent protochlorophyllide reductase subunit B
VIFDSWVHPLMMGLEEHLIGMFRHDFEFVDGHRSHLGEAAPSPATTNAVTEAATTQPPEQGSCHWAASGEAELSRIPFFVRSKIRKNTEAFARERGILTITDEVLYEAKAKLSK